MTGPTPDPVTPVNQVTTNNDNTDDSPSLHDQILDQMSSLKALIKQHNKRSGVVIQPICLSFDDEERSGKGKGVEGGLKDGHDEDLRKPYKEIPKSPFTRRINKFSAPSHRTPTNLNIYDGSTDPDDHVTRFVGATN
ncbi:hypothetical protein Tco_0773281 [Tanacetum coccineum]|uniref:Reverse transcriptase domain-containing protein n=1 Tax=Tanacetum coccineum TaxID=301880 RepID=A0ABQ4ZKF0_9ASTR